MAAMEVTTDRTMSARFNGSEPASSANKRALNSKKSWASSVMALFRASLPTFLAYVSGSSPSGNSTTFTAMPSASSKSMPRSDARMPAASPSKMTVTFLVKRRMSWIWPGVNAVPLDATTLRTPAWCMAMTSV